MQIAQIGPSLQGIFTKTVVAPKTAASAVTASAQSEERPPEVWLPSLSDDERLVEEHARSFDLAVCVEIRTVTCLAPKIV